MSAPTCDVSPTFLGAHTLPPEYKGDRAAYVDLVCEQDDPGHRAREARRCRRCVLRDHRLYAGRNGARLRGRESAWAAREAARRAAVQFARRDPGREIRCALRRPSRTSLRRRGRDDGASRHGRGAAADRVLFPARDEEAADRGAAPRRRAACHRDRLQSRHLAGGFAADRAQYGVHALRPDPGRGARRYDAQRAPERWAPTTSARWRPENPPISRSGGFPIRPSFATGSAPICSSTAMSRAAPTKRRTS